MKFHPAILMLISWLIGYALFFGLPFSLEGRVLTLYGFLMTWVFLATFCVGALAASRPIPQQPRDPHIVINFLWADRVIMSVCVLAMVVLLIDVSRQNIFDLAASYAQRSERSTGLLQATESDSSIFFQLGFLTYPAGFVYLVREIAFRVRPNLINLGIFGIGPPALVSLAMGGRGALFFAIVYAFMSYLLRKQVFPPQPKTKRPNPNLPLAVRLNQQPKGRAAFQFGPGSTLALGAVSVVAMIYFIGVFFTRAGGAEDIALVLGNISGTWGVGFNGRGSDFFYSTFGPQVTYLIFVFSWYWCQGVVMSNQIFSGYDGPALLGTYGIDLVSAVVRRTNSEFLAEGFSHLLRMNVYGFVPSAWGSLYIDLKLFGLIPALIWGWLAGFVYRNVRRALDPRYLLLAPFVSLPIIISMNNTPIGVSNGLVLHIWMLVAFFLSKRVVVGGEATAGIPARI